MSGLACRLKLLGGFELSIGGTPVPLTFGCQRVLAFLGLQIRAVPRSQIAGTLWPDVTEASAAGNLRSALWRIRRKCPGVVESGFTNVWLVGESTVDVRERTADARRILMAFEMRNAAWLPDYSADEFTVDLLPNWFDDWTTFERERYRQLRIHALEAICRQLAEVGLFARAVDAGLAAVAAEPLRETAHRALIAAHLAEGNRNEAIREFERYRLLLDRELGEVPSTAMLDELVGSSESQLRL
jgi:DNA-binding SARP family transcriptional activator